MRLLFVTYFFPPFRTSAAVRTGQTAKYLSAMGHDVRVVTADRLPWERSLPLEIPRDHVAYTPWLGSGVTAIVAGRRLFRANVEVARSSAERRLVTPSAKRLIRLAQRNLLYMPDDCIGWYPWALRASLRIAEQQPVDLIYASAGPFTSLLVAATVARVCGAPWVGELRDLWSDNHYRSLPPWFRGIDARLEARVLKSAAGLVTMSELWAEGLESKYAVPVRAVYNGFEERDEQTSRRNEARSESIVIAHLGMLYGGKRDPTPLFQAIQALGDDAHRVRVEFYGPEQDLVRRLARSSGVEDRVRVFGDIPYAESLTVQSNSDVLLLLMWDTPEEAGVLPGKLFEYLGARRPVLAVGAGYGVGAHLISSRRLGLASSDPVEIAVQLRTWIAEKDALGRPEPLSAEAVADFSRVRQVQRLSEFLCELSTAAKSP